MNWIVRLSAQHSTKIVHQTVDATNYSNAVQVAGEKFGENHVIHLIFEGIITRAAVRGVRG